MNKKQLVLYIVGMIIVSAVTTYIAKNHYSGEFYRTTVTQWHNDSHKLLESINDRLTALEANHDKRHH